MDRDHGTGNVNDDNDDGKLINRFAMYWEYAPNVIGISTEYNCRSVQMLRQKSNPRIMKRVVNVKWRT